MSSAGVAPVRNADERIARLEAQVAELAARVARLEARTERDEEEADAGAPVAFPVPAPVVETPSAGALLGLAGSTLLALGGAYFIRAVAESGAVPAGLGIALGLVYAAAWLGFAVRSRAPIAANARGITAALVAFPLLYEAVSRFHVFGARSADAAVVVTLAVFLLAAARARLAAVSWAAVLGALGAVFAILAETQAIQTSAAALFVAAFFTLVVEHVTGQGGPRWPAALALDVVLPALFFVFTRPGGVGPQHASLDAFRVETFALALAGLYVADAVVRAIVRRREPGAFELVQGPLALALGLVVAVAALGAAELPKTPIGIAALAAGTAVYASARSAGRRGLPRATALFEWTGLALLLAGAPLAFSAPAAALLWCVLAVGLAAFPIGRAPSVHAAIALAAAALASGLLASGAAAFLARAPELPAAIVAVGLAAALCDLLAHRPVREGAVEHAARLAYAAVWLLALGAVVMEAAARIADGAPAPLSAAGTAVLALSSLVLASAARRPRLAELKAFVYPLLVLAALKLVVVDLRAGTRLTLVGSFALVGMALIALPSRLRGETARAEE